MSTETLVYLKLVKQQYGQYTMTTNPSTGLSAKRRPPPVGSFRPSRCGHHAADHHPGEVSTSGTATVKRYIDGLSGLFTARWATGRKEPRPPPESRLETLSSSRCVVLRHRARDRAGGPAGWLRPGDLNRVFFTTGGGEGGRERMEAGQKVLQTAGASQTVQSHFAVHRAYRPPVGLWRSPVCRPSLILFEPITLAGFRAPNTNWYGRRKATTPTSGVRPVGGNRIAEAISSGRRLGCRGVPSNRCRTPAAASPRPDTSERVRDLRPLVRRAAGVR